MAARRPARRLVLPLLVLLIVTAASTLVVHAGNGATAEQLVAKAQTSYRMECGTFEGSWSCGNWPWSAVFEPLRGEVTHLVVRSDEFSDDGMSEGAEAMMVDFVDAVCVDLDRVSAFVATVAAQTAPREVSPAELPTCRLTGGLYDGCELDCYWVDAVVHEPPPTPPPTTPPTPTSPPTPTPTAQPGSSTPAPRSGTPTPTPTATTVPTVSPSSTASVAISPTGSPSEAALSPTPTAAPASGSQEPTGTASPTPEQQVAGGNPTPSPSPDPAAPVPPRGPGLFARSVPLVGDVSGDPVAVGGSALLAVLLVLFVAFPGELFNDTVESNYDEIRGWFRRGPIGRIGGLLAFLPHGPIAIALFVAIAAFLNALLDPGLGLDLASLATYLGFLVALVVTLIAFDGPPLFVHRRRTGELGSMRVLPWTLLIVAIFVFVSRTAALQPGYLYGIVLGIVFLREDAPQDEGREQAAGAVWTLGVALAAWLLLGLLRSSSPDPTSFGTILAETALAAVMVAGIEAVALGLVPFRFLPGAAIYRWSRPAWAVLFGIGIFAFVHVLIGPNVGYLSELSLAGLAAAAAAFVAFGAVSVAVWSYFRFRPARSAEGPTPSDG
jgi:hypothetical protein